MSAKLITAIVTALAIALIVLVWAVPAEAQEVSVKFKCTSSGADVIFTNTDDESLQILLEGTFEDELDGEIGLGPGQSETISTEERRLGFEVLEDKPNGASVHRSLDLSSCADSDTPSKAPDAGVVG
jgi:hypothetical protein